MIYGEVCAGYDGLGKAIAQVFGATPAWFSEYDPNPARILKYHYPDVPNYGDMTKIDWAAIRLVDIMSGGTPCQDLSHAGRRRGMTEGTRSNLWVHMREGIAIQQPEWVVWENVRGAYSACAESEADSHLGRCPRCMDPSNKSAEHDPNLRALGRVLGDLASLGYDTQWRGIRASDVGAPHGRYRVFVLGRRRAPRDPDLQDVERSRTTGRPNADQEQSTRPDRSTGHGPATDAGRAAVRELTGSSPSEETRQDPSNGPRSDHGEQPPRNRREAPTDTDSLGHDRRGQGPEQDRRGEPQDGGNPAADAASDARRLGDGNDVRPRRGADQRGKTAGRGTAATDAERYAGPEERGRDTSGQEGGDRTSGEPGRHSGVRSQPGRYTTDDINWGPYEPAIRRWERISGYPVPRPTEPSGRSGKQRLSPYFTEWMMGQEPGWITDPRIWEGMSEGAARNAQLKAAGNGVVTQQAIAALRDMKAAFEAMD